MNEFDERIQAIKTAPAPIAVILEAALILIDDLNAAYKKVWAQECAATMALELRDEQIARLQGIRQDSFDTFDIDPNNGD